MRTAEETHRDADYFNVIRHFGLKTNAGHSPCESPDKPYRIPVSLEGHGRVMCYGKSVEEVCSIALAWLQSKEECWWKKIPSSDRASNLTAEDLK